MEPLQIQADIIEIYQLSLSTFVSIVFTLKIY